MFLCSCFRATFFETLGYSRDTYEHRGSRRPVRRRRQGQDRRPDDAALLVGGALPGRTQRRPHRLRQRQEVRAAPDPVRHPPRRRALHHRQRRRGGSAGAVQGDRRAGDARHRRRRSPADQRQGAPDPAVSPRARRVERGAPRRAQDRDDVARHRPGLRGQDRPARHSRLRPGRHPGAGRRSARERQRAQPDHQGLDARLEAGLRPAAGVRRAHAALDRRRVAGARPGDAQGRERV